MELSVPLDAGELFEKLEALYGSYLETKRAAENARSWGERMFGHLFTSSDVSGSSATDDDFYRDVEAICAALEETLCADNDAAAYIAERAVRFMLLGSQERPNRSGLMLLACEHLCAPLLPHLRRERLEAIRAEYVSRTPPRMMLPKQKELLALMDETLASRQS